MGSSPISSNARSVAAAPPHVLLSTKCLSYLEALAPPGAAQCVGAAARARAKPCSHAPAVPGPSAARACVCVCVRACVRMCVWACLFAGVAVPSARGLSLFVGRRGWAGACLRE